MNRALKHNINLNWLKLFFLPPLQLNYVHCWYFSCGSKILLKKPPRLPSIQHWNKKWSCAHQGPQRELGGMKLILSKANISCALFSATLQPTASWDQRREEPHRQTKLCAFCCDKRTKGLLSCAKAMTGKAGETVSRGNKEGSKPQRLVCSIQESPRIISVSTVS